MSTIDPGNDPEKAVKLSRISGEKGSGRDRGTSRTYFDPITRRTETITYKWNKQTGAYEPRTAADAQKRARVEDYVATQRNRLTTGDLGYNAGRRVNEGMQSAMPGIIQTTNEFTQGTTGGPTSNYYSRRNYAGPREPMDYPERVLVPDPEAVNPAQQPRPEKKSRFEDDL